jgi:formate hydrogenlyase subunit 3/multisubunit Na+/H+ antiporter MnhD subunit
MVTRKAHPYSAAFVFLFLPATISFLVIRYLVQYTTLDITPNIALILQYLGLFMYLTGGIMAAFQRHAGRILGFGAIFEIGMLLLALSLIPQPAGISPQKGIVFVQFIPKALGFGVWALSLGILKTTRGNLQLQTLHGLGYRYPAASAGVVLGNLSIAAFPLLAGFPVSLALWLAVSQTNPIAANLSLIGNLGLIIAALRTFFILFNPAGGVRWEILENRTQLILLVAGGIFLLLLGIFPQVYFPGVINIALSTSTPGP